MHGQAKVGQVRAQTLRRGTLLVCLALLAGCSESGSNPPYSSEDQLLWPAFPAADSMIVARDQIVAGEDLAYVVSVCLPTDARVKITSVEVEDSTNGSLTDHFVVSLESPSDELGAALSGEEIQQAHAFDPPEPLQIEAQCDQEWPSDGVVVAVTPEDLDQEAILSGFHIAWEEVGGEGRSGDSYFPTALVSCPVGADDTCSEDVPLPRPIDSG